MITNARDAVSAFLIARKGPFILIGGKARLVSDLFCDGLGACIGTCPEGAMSVIEREVVPYYERTVMENITEAGVTGNRKGASRNIFGAMVKLYCMIRLSIPDRERYSDP